MSEHTGKRDQGAREERMTTLHQLEEWIERPMQFLGLVWLALLVLELTYGLSPLLAAVSAVIWAIFIADFVLRLVLAPDKGDYLKRNWLVALSLFVPALRALRFARAFRVLRAARGVRLVRIITSVNRGMNSLRRAMERRGLGYIGALTLIVMFAGAAGMFAFERATPAVRGFNDFPTALWWTGMLMTTLGSDFWPQTFEGRLLCFLLAAYAFAVWGYITASLATFFIGRDAERADTELAGQSSVEQLRAEIGQLSLEVRTLRESLRTTP